MDKVQQPKRVLVVFNTLCLYIEEVASVDSLVIFRRTQ